MNNDFPALNAPAVLNSWRDILDLLAPFKAAFNDLRGGLCRSGECCAKAEAEVAINGEFVSPHNFGGLCSEHFLADFNSGKFHLCGGCHGAFNFEDLDDDLGGYCSSCKGIF